MEFKFYLIFITALVPLIVGMIWYHKAVFGSAWMKATGMTEEKAKSMNMVLIFVLTYIFGIFISFILWGMTIHQLAMFSIFADDKSPEGQEYMKNFFKLYGDRYRTFGHGAFHGVLAAIGLALPVLGVNAMFEGKNWKYIAINTGFWIVCFAIIGGIICQFI